MICVRYMSNTISKKHKNVFVSRIFSLSVLSYFESFNNYLIEKGEMDQIMEIFKYFEEKFHRTTSQKYLKTTRICPKYMESIY
ncbi:LOW QUALITY PROTEIN: hypothetical protein HZS_1187 [Henneguya salminicola]|nr:LOW QUALITY PROTEIN: hypothetical protein HZS_1187 [Henneguya salminicola]